MIKYPKLQDINWLMGEVQQKSLHQIAEEQKCSYSAVAYLVKKYNIILPKRTVRRVFPQKSINQKLAIKRDFPNGRFGNLHPRWKGGKNLVNGYYTLHILNHPRSGQNNRVFEHILIAEKTLGRYLTKDEIVHHINGNKLDNTPENLLIMLRSDHVGYHMKSGKNIQELLGRIEYLETLLKENDIIFA